MPRKKTLRKPTFNIALIPQLGRVHAYQPYANALRLRSKVQKRAHAQDMSQRILRQVYACAQPGVSSAVFRSSVSSVQWQLEQKERYRATHAKLRGFSETTSKSRPYPPPLYIDHTEESFKLVSVKKLEPLSLQKGAFLVVRQV